MLILSRKPGQKVRVGRDTIFVVLEVKGNQVRIGIDAPPHIPILREELYAPSARAVANATPQFEEMPCAT
jgi:carbon storage regulator